MNLNKANEQKCSLANPKIMGWRLCCCCRRRC